MHSKVDKAVHNSNQSSFTVLSTYHAYFLIEGGKKWISSFLFLCNSIGLHFGHIYETGFCFLNWHWQAIAVACSASSFAFLLLSFWSFFLHIEAVLTILWMCQSFKPEHGEATTKGNRARVPSTYAAVVWLRHLRLTYRTCLVASAFCCHMLTSCHTQIPRHTYRQTKGSSSHFEEGHAHCHSQFGEWYLPFSSINLPQFPLKEHSSPPSISISISIAHRPIES